MAELIKEMSPQTPEYWWVQFIMKAVFGPSFFISPTGRKYSYDLSFHIPGEAWNNGFDSLSVSNLGYRGEKNKMNQLTRIYFNEEGIKDGRKKLTERVDGDYDFNSIVVPTMSNKKDKRSQGYCMGSIAVTHVPGTKYNPKFVGVTIFYRITELVQKFGADLLFLHDIVIPSLLPEGLEVDQVNFYFTNAYFSPLFLPVLSPYIDLVEFLTDIESKFDQNQVRGRALFKSCCRAAILPLIIKDPEHYNYRTRRLMHHLTLKNLDEGHIDSKRMMKFFKDRPELKNLLSSKEDKE